MLEKKGYKWAYLATQWVAVLAALLNYQALKNGLYPWIVYGNIFRGVQLLWWIASIDCLVFGSTGRNRRAAKGIILAFTAIAAVVIMLYHHFSKGSSMDKSIVSGFILLGSMFVSYYVLWMRHVLHQSAVKTLKGRRIVITSDSSGYFEAGSLQKCLESIGADAVFEGDDAVTTGISCHVRMSGGSEHILTVYHFPTGASAELNVENGADWPKRGALELAIFLARVERT